MIIFILMILGGIVYFWMDVRHLEDQREDKLLVQYSVSEDNLLQFGGLDGYLTVKIENRTFAEDGNLTCDGVPKNTFEYFTENSFNDFDLVQVTVDYIVRVPVLRELDEEHSIVVHQTKFYRLYRSSYTLDDSLKDNNYWLIKLEWGE